MKRIIHTAKGDREVTVTYTMADGTKRDSMEGVIVPVNEHTKISYQIMAKWIMREMEKDGL